MPFFSLVMLLAPAFYYFGYRYCFFFEKSRACRCGC